MKIVSQEVGSNQSEITITLESQMVTVRFSYETMIGLYVAGKTKATLYINENFYSSTTSRHRNKMIKENLNITPVKKTLNELEHILEKTLYSAALSKATKRVQGKN